MYDWAFLYVMSYDNDLDRWSGRIERSLAAGLDGDRVAVTILADRVRPDGVRRIGLTRGRREEEVLATEDMTDAGVLAAYLAWAAKRFPARKYVLTVLNHGGKLDQMYVDRHPTRGRRPQARWMSAQRAGAVIRTWGGGLAPGRLELLFLQQCGRASIENLYSHRNAAPYILASPHAVGTPNTYYAQTVRFAGDHPDADGERIARTIMAKDQHYQSYVLVRGDVLAEWPTQADALVAALPDRGAHALRFTARLVPSFVYGHERNYDLLESVGAVFTATGHGADPQLARFGDWVQRKLVVSHQSRRGPATGCGIATRVPATRQALAAYAALPAYGRTRWLEIARRLTAAENARVANEAGEAHAGSVAGPAAAAVPRGQER